MERGKEEKEDEQMRKRKRRKKGRIDLPVRRKPVTIHTESSLVTGSVFIMK